MKPWNDIKAGDSIFNKVGDESKVLEVGASGKTFCRSIWKDPTRDWETEAYKWTHIKEAIRLGWTLGEKKKDKIEELEEWQKGTYGYIDEPTIAKVKELFTDNSA